MALTREQILKADDLPREEVPVQEWGGTVWVRALTGAERDEYEGVLGDPKMPMVERWRRVKSRVLLAGIVDESGKALFTAPDLPALVAKSGAALDRCYEAIARLSGLNRQSQEDAVKNSPSPAAGSVSSGGSASPSANHHVPVSSAA